MVAGVVNVGADGMLGTSDDNLNFGDSNDKLITGGTDRAGFISKIASIIIKGTVDGTAASGDHFGFAAQQIVAFKVGTTSLAFTSAPGQSFDLGTTGDVTAHEVTT
jgi:hypothetical protein